MSSKAELKALQAKWYKKLKKSGFNDIEHDEERLNRPSYRWHTEHTPEEIQAKMDYYSFATWFLDEHAFESRLDKIIWEYHANGLGVREITKVLKGIRIRTNRTTVWQIVKRLQHIMKTQYIEGYRLDD